MSDIPRPETTITIARNVEFRTLDFGASVLADYDVIDLAYERLVRPEVADGLPTGKLIGELAESLEQSEDGLSWLVAIEPGHRFSDGTEVTAEAVKFTFDRARLIGRAPSQQLFWLKDVVAEGRYRVRFNLTLPVPFFGQILGLPAASIVNPSLIREHEKNGDLGQGWLATHTAGSGPYQLEYMDRRTRAVLAPNPHARHGPRYFEGVILKTIRQETTRIMELDKASVDIIDSPGIEDAVWLENRGGIEVIRGPSPIIHILEMNNEKPPLDDERVRRAISLALDRKGMLAEVVSGEGQLLKGFIPEGVAGFDPELPDYEYDPQRARELLREAGVAPGTSLDFTHVSSASLPPGWLLAVQRDLGEIGLEVEIRFLAPLARKLIFDGRFDLTVRTISLDFPDPWIIVTFEYDPHLIGSVGNMSRYRNMALAEMLQAAAIETDPELREAMYRRIQRQVLDDFPNAALFRLDRRIAIRESIKGVNYNFAQPFTYNVEDMWRARRQPVESK